MIAVVAALKEELTGYLASGRYRETGREGDVRWFESPSSRHVAVVLGGIGREAIESAARFALSRYAPDLVVSAGFAGGVRPEFRPGDLVLCDQTWSVEGPPERWSVESAQVTATKIELVRELEALRTGAIRGDCLSVPQVVTGRTMKGWIGSHFPVAIIDMESYWVSLAAAGYGVPMIAVKSVVDPVEQTLPPLVAKMAGGHGAPRWASALGSVLARPGQLPDLLRLASQARAARESLARFLDALASSPATSGEKMNV